MSTPEFLALKNKYDAAANKLQGLESLAETMRTQIREDIIVKAQMAGKVLPYQLADARNLATSFGDDFAGLQAHFDGLPQLTHPNQQGVSGDPNADDADPGDRLQSIAYALKRQTPSLSDSQALILACELNPRIYQEYVNGRG